MWKAGRGLPKTMGPRGPVQVHTQSHRPMPLGARCAAPPEGDGPGVRLSQAFAIALDRKRVQAIQGFKLRHGREQPGKNSKLERALGEERGEGRTAA